MELRSPPAQHPQGQHELVDGKVLALCQWQDADMAMNAARHHFEVWLHSDTPAVFRLYAYRTHEALHEATRAIDVLVETLRVEALKYAFHTEGNMDV